jgi:outer membrane receptor protein involved in Fe transport
VQRRFASGLLAALIAFASTTHAASPSRTPQRFDIRAASLADALDRFSEQSGLQVVYDLSALAAGKAPHVVGSMQVDAALDRLLERSGLTWRYVDKRTVLVQRREAHASASAADAVGAQRASTAAGPITLSVIEVVDDPRRILPNEASDTAFGFSRTLLETPRSVSVISQETIDLFGLSAVEDLVAVVPGVFTTTRFGIQGAVDVRNVPADTYFRGMKRLTLQGHGRSVLAAMDTIEIVGGPASPIYGMGKIGGYVNVMPKSGRARSGKYLTERQGFAQAIAGSYDRGEVSFGIGGPLRWLERTDRRGGYYVYGLIEDSDSYALGVPIDQRIMQAATSVDNFIGPMRLETGASYQQSRTAGALTGRFTQDLVDTGRYIRGTPLSNLDANGNGAIGFLEMQRGSPVRGNLSATNQPLLQTWAWPLDAAGNPLPIDQLPRVPGIPVALYDYLVAHPEADPTGRLRAQGPGGPLPTSAYVPIGMVLDPRTVGYETLNLRRATAFEKDLQAHFFTAFFDLLYDRDPDLTVKNQLFFDGMQQYKNSNQPFVQEQDVYVVEDKLTLTKQLRGLPDWLSLQALASLNARSTVSKGRSSGTGDFSNSRSDAMAPTWRDELGGMTPNTTFQSPIDNPDLASDGYPWVTDYRTRFTELGIGVLFDVDLFSRANVLLGARYDTSHARNVDYAGAFNPNTGTSANPGAYTTADVAAEGDEGAPSWSISVSYALTPAIRPYATWARSSIMLDGNNNALTNATISAGYLGAASFGEIGFKASLFDERLYFGASAFRQYRADVDSTDDPAQIFAYATATDTRGWEAQLKWVPARNLVISSYAIRQETFFDPNAGSTQVVDARTLGFQDVLDANGNVIYPAEAFLYGGRARIVLPNGVAAHRTKQGNPQTQIGFSTSFELDRGLGFTLSGNYFSETCTGRLCIVRLPESWPVNTGVYFDAGHWGVKLDVLNVLDERYFRARSGDTLGNVLAQAMPDRHWQLTVRARF